MAIAPDDVIVSVLASRGELSDRQAVRAVAAFVDASTAEAALRRLDRSGQIGRRGARWMLTPQGWRHAVAAAVIEFGFEWRTVRDAILPALALKLELSPGVVTRLLRGDGLRAAVLAATYGWPADRAPPLTLIQVRSWLVAHALTMGFPGLKLPPAA
ncbi:MAG: hypothetical protein AAFN74_19780, partial [Myxococcota bacterium]